MISYIQFYSYKFKLYNCKKKKKKKGKVAIGKARYLLNIVFQHLMVQIHSFPLLITDVLLIFLFI